MRTIWIFAVLLSFNMKAMAQDSSTTESLIESLEKIGVEVDSREDGSLKVEVENEISVGNDILISAIGTTEKPGPLRKLENIKEFWLADSEVTAEGIALITEITTIEELVLNHTRVDAEGIAHVAKLPKLKFLMPGMYVPDEGIKHLMGHKTLEALDLQTSSITDESIKYLSTIENLTYLNISNQNLTKVGLSQLRNIPKLTDLRLDNAGLTDRDLASLSDMKELKFLSLNFNLHLTGIGFKLVTGLDQLEDLVMYQVSFQGHNVQYLKRLPQLRTLRLYGKEQWVEVPDFIALKSMPNLKKIVVGGSKLTADAESLVKTEMPNVEFIALGE